MRVYYLSIKGATIVEPRSSAELRPMGSNSSVGFVTITTEDTITTQTLVNCSWGLCNEGTFDGSESLIEVKCSPGGVNLNMNVYAINECGNLSDVLVVTTRLACDGRSYIFYSCIKGVLVHYGMRRLCLWLNSS